ncbi:MAG TPA: TIR domain-containing protein [Sphingomicrobium sp.]|nr:TIR domain-containing protein [Sphingomicrobium sp.]
MARIFLSYSRADANSAKAIAKALKVLGHEVWWDGLIPGGSRFASEIDAAIKRSDAVVVLWSRSSIESSWVQDEAALGRDTGRLVPVLIDQSEPPLGFRQFQAIDLKVWKGRGAASGLAALGSAVAVKAVHQSETTAQNISTVNSRRSGGGSPRFMGFALAACFALVLLAGSWWYISRFGWGSRAEEKSVAVLPFANLSSGADTQYFSDGMTEELISTLGRVPGLKVTARSSAFQFKGRNLDAREIGQRLGVARIVEGSVRKDAQRLRISVQLVDAAAGQQIWSESYDRQLADVFAVQEEIAQAVVSAMNVRRSGQGPKLVGERTQNIGAYQAYLRGRYFWNKRDGPGLTKALRHFKEAVDLDPTFAQAYSGIADSYLLLPLHTPLPTTEAFPRAKAAAKRAVDLNDDLAEGHTSLAYVLFWNDWNYPAAEREFRQAIELNPNYATAHHWYSEFLVTAGRVNQAIKVAARAEELDPLSPIISTDAAANFYFARRYKEAIPRLQQVLELDPSFLVARWYLAKAYGQQGRHADSIAELRKAVQEEPSNDWSKAYLGYAYGAAGQRAAAQKVLERMQAEASRRYVRPDILGLLHLAAGNREAALSTFERAVAEKAIYPFIMARDPQLDTLRSEPKFRALLKRMRIPS